MEIPNVWTNDNNCNQFYNCWGILVWKWLVIQVTLTDLPSPHPYSKAASGKINGCIGYQIPCLFKNKIKKLKYECWQICSFICLFFLHQTTFLHHLHRSNPSNLMTECLVKKNSKSCCFFPAAVWHLCIHPSLQPSVTPTTCSCCTINTSSSLRYLLCLSY